MKITLSPKRKAAINFIGLVRYSLKNAIAESRVSLPEIAVLVGVPEKELRDQLNGSQDITAGRIAEICWAIRREVELVVHEDTLKDKWP